MARTLRCVHTLLKSIRWDRYFKDASSAEEARDKLDETFLDEVRAVPGGEAAYNFARAYHGSHHFPFADETNRIVACGYLSSLLKSYGIRIPFSEASHLLDESHRICWDLVETLIYSHRDYLETGR